MRGLFSRRHFMKAGIGGLCALIGGLVSRKAATAGGRVSEPTGGPPPVPVPRAVTDPWPVAAQTFTYDASGRLTGITDPLSHVVTYVYDAQGEVIRIVPPEDRPPTPPGAPEWPRRLWRPGESVT